MPMHKRNVDEEVEFSLQHLIDQMRAKRLSSELPMPSEKANDETEHPGDADGEQEALEAMLDKGEDEGD